ncbi:unnamed protein product [Oikopleura dioica]|uniref:Cytochrome b561 domain-containing protein n=1 Tax=Oikopleura dioica TaxID=34765 RepID=E4WYI1_OIKDI|nr:unnamed protein product [Oikopleura dioica]
MLTGAWIFYETAVFKKSRVRIEVYLKNTIHGFIALVALAASCFGYWAIYENKELIGKEHFTSYHGQVGIASLAMIFVNQLLGAAAHYLKISAARKAHRMFSFLILSCFCAALSLGLWSGWADHNLHWILRYSGTTLATVPILMWL